ncbi:S1 family peptidase [Rhodococcus tibetensis]|uniref:S1 family peptidase n=1 Tax=Rhodococcus tibetensis TaxID=2965064 RepID=A0ABT1QFG0_9NOCA|nr:S1 family peptidase [Rhodococcus sp. FXJ9.536]MCQ4120995.1 S1 family peptidase [Rhodococcus sp. FXJ9.536]
MRSSIARRAAVFGSAALLLLGPLTTSAQADPVEPEVSDQAAALPLELVDAIQRDLALSPDQYLEHAELGQKLAEFAKIARIQFPDAFAGTWLDDAGNAVVGVAEGTDKVAAVAAAETAGFQVKDVAQSESSLQAQLKTLDGWLDTQPPAVADLVRGVTIDIVNNGLVLRADDAGGLQLPDFLQGARVVQSPATAAPQPSTDLAPIAEVMPADAMLGGDAYGSLGGGIGLRCSLGFNGTDNSGGPVNITAGHCDPNLAAAGTVDASEAFALAPGGTGPRVGTFAKTSLDNHDYAIIRADAGAAHRFENNGVRVPGAAPLAITGTADPVVGAPVCKSGLTTGYTCGVVKAVGQTVSVGERTLADSFSTSICALQGDSGGTIVTGTQALGISSASNVGQYPVCQVADVVTFVLGESPELFATPINAVLAENPGLRVRTS